MSRPERVASAQLDERTGGHAYGSVYPGPIGAILTPQLLHLEDKNANTLPWASSLCGACREVCPVRIDIPRMLLELRDKTTVQGLTPRWVTFGLSVFRRVATRPALFRRAQATASWLTRRAAKDGWVRWLPGHMTRWSQKRDFPAFAAKSFQRQWRERAR